MKETILRMLLLHDGLETKSAWTAVLEGDNGVVMENVLCDEEEVRVELIAAIDEVVPYLPDYSAVSAKLTALMSYVEEAYSNRVNRLVQGWLQSGHSVHFRRWVLCDWLKCSHLTSVDPVELLQWRYALFVAVTNETVKKLKRKLLQLLSAVDEMIDARFQDKNSEQKVETPVAAMQSIETVEELLDFCFLHAEQLVSCSLLCAAKLHALAVRTQRSAIKLAEDDEVLVRLRWSLMLKLMLFKPLLRHAVALKTIPGKITASQLWTSQELERFVAVVGLTRREMIVDKMRESRLELERVFASGTEHIYPKTNRKLVRADVDEYIHSLSSDKKKLLLVELERDLDEVPPFLFTYVFMFFGLICSACASAPAPADQDLLVQSVSILFAPFERRSHDTDSCLDVLSLLHQQSIATNSIWLDHPLLYLQVIESMSETATLQVDPKLKWTARMALHQLLFECDVQLLQLNLHNLSKLLPPRTMRLVSIRVGN